jgi:hypothetical protein
MSSTTLLRLSGLALLFAGVLLAIAIPFHPSDTDPQALVRPAWVPVHTVFTIAVLLSLFGLPGLYLRVQGKSGWLGLLGFVLLFTGSAFLLAGLFFEAFVASAIASSAAGQALLDPAGSLLGGTLSTILLLSSSIFSLGCLLFCIAILRTRTATSVGGLLFLAGIPLAYWPPLPQLVGTIGGMLLGIGSIWFGYILLTRSSERAVQAQATA